MQINRNSGHKMKNEKRNGNRNQSYRGKKIGEKEQIYQLNGKQDNKVELKKNSNLAKQRCG